MNQKTNTLNKQLDEIANYIPLGDVVNSAISKVSVSWHIDHMLKVINGVSQTIINSKPECYKKSFNTFRMLCYTFQFFPRGKAKAPKVVLPPEIITSEQLESQLKNANQFILEINSLHNNAFFTHHIFGKLNKQRAKTFLQIHTKHHLKIIRDIYRIKT